MNPGSRLDEAILGPRSSGAGGDRSPDKPPSPFPGPIHAIALTAVAWLTTLVWREAATPWMGPMMAGGLAILAGPGLVALLSMRSLPPPHRERLGLRGFAPFFLAPIVLLAPALFLDMEIQSLVRLMLGSRRGVGIHEWNPALIHGGSIGSLASSLLVVGAVLPMASEWFYRGLIQQGLVQRLGVGAGVLLTSALAGAAQTEIRAPAPALAGGLVTTFCWAAVLGLLRVASGSLAGPIVLHSAVNVIWVLAVWTSREIPIEALTVSGTHVRAIALIPSALSGIAGLALLVRSARLGR